MHRRPFAVMSSNFKHGGKCYVMQAHRKVLWSEFELQMLPNSLPQQMKEALGVISTIISVIITTGYPLCTYLIHRWNRSLRLIWALILYRVIFWGSVDQFMNHRIISRGGIILRAGKVLPEITIHSIYSSILHHQSDMTLSQACKPITGQLSFEIRAAIA